MSELFELTGGGIGLMPDPDDNPDGHVVPHSEAGLRISFEVVNVGDVAGEARVGVELDEVFQTEWTSEQIEPGQSQAGFVSLSRLDPADYEVLVFVNPGSGQNDHETNSFTLP